MNDPRNPGWAIVLILLANLFFAGVDTSTKWLLNAGIFAVQLAFVRYFVHCVISVADLGRPGSGLHRPGPRQLRLLLLRAFFIVSATVANFFALGHLPLSVSAAILNLSPVLVCLFAGLFFGERLGAMHWSAVGVGFLGVLVIINPFGEAVNWYAILMLYPATGMALYALFTQRLAVEVPPATMQFITGALGSAVLLPVALMTWKTPETALEWVLLGAIGFFAWFGHELLTRAHGYASSSFIMPFSYSFVLYLSFSGWLIFGTIPTQATVVGGMMVVGAGLLIWHGRRAGVPA